MDVDVEKGDVLLFTKSKWMNVVRTTMDDFCVELFRKTIA